MSRKGILVVAALFGIAFLLLSLATRGYRKVDAMQSMEKAMAAVRREFPEARPVSTTQLAAWMEEPGGVALVDVRTPEEYGVSRLPGALGKTSIEKISDPAVGARHVVIYDSVGIHSAELVEALVAGGAVETVYLEGGIFQWANEGRPLVDADGEPTTKVHPYNKLWGRLLKKPE